MFDIGGFELLVIAVLGLIIIGPGRLPEVVRSVSLWVGRLRRNLSHIKRGIAREFQLDEVRRQLHNEEIMQQLEAGKREIEQAVSGRDCELPPGDDGDQAAANGSDSPPGSPASPPASSGATGKP